MESRWDITKEIDGERFPEKIISPIDGAEMVLVPKGPFIMGISRKELVQISILDQVLNPVFATEVPERTVHLEAYYIDRYPVTNYQYLKFTEETRHRKPLLMNEPEWNQPMKPVVFIGLILSCRRRRLTGTIPARSSIRH